MVIEREGLGRALLLADQGGHHGGPHSHGHSFLRGIQYDNEGTCTLFCL